MCVCVRFQVNILFDADWDFFENMPLHPPTKYPVYVEQHIFSESESPQLGVPRGLRVVVPHV